MAQIKIGSTFEEPKGIHVFQNSTWRTDNYGYVFHNGEWIPFIEYALYLYNLGVENVQWNYSDSGLNGEHSGSKNSDHLYQISEGSGYSKFTTDLRVDLTEYNKLYIDWELDIADYTTAIFCASPTTLDTDYVARVFHRGLDGVSGTRRIDELDISGLSGEFYLMVRLASNGVIKTYRVWTE